MITQISTNPDLTKSQPFGYVPVPRIMELVNQRYKPTLSKYKEQMGTKQSPVLSLFEQGNFLNDVSNGPIKTVENLQSVVIKRMVDLPYKLEKESDNNYNYPKFLQIFDKNKHYLGYLFIDSLINDNIEVNSEKLVSYTGRYKDCYDTSLHVWVTFPVPFPTNIKGYLFRVQDICGGYFNFTMLPSLYV